MGESEDQKLFAAPSRRRDKTCPHGTRNSLPKWLQSKKSCIFCCSVELPKKRAMFLMAINIFTTIVEVKNITTKWCQWPVASLAVQLPVCQWLTHLSITIPTLCNFTQETYDQKIDHMVLWFLLSWQTIFSFHAQVATVLIWWWLL